MFARKHLLCRLTPPYRQLDPLANSAQICPINPNHLFCAQTSERPLCFGGRSGLKLDNTWNTGVQYGCTRLVFIRNPGSPARDQAAYLGVCFSCIGTTGGSFFLTRAS